MDNGQNGPNGQNGSNGPNGQNDENNDGKKNGELKISVIICMILIFAIIILFAYVKDKIDETQNVEISYGEFLEKLEKGKLESVIIDRDRLVLTPKKSKNKKKITDEPMTYYTGIIEDPQLVERLNKAYKSNKLEFKMKLESQSSKMFDILMSVIPLGLTVLMVVLAWKMVTRGGGMMGVGKSNAKVYVENETGVTFADVAGQEEAKESLTELVDFLHNPTKYTEIGAKLPKGALLVGPPGTGKTLLAKAVAGEAKVPFFSLSGSNFVEMFVGVGASRVRDLFKEAQQKAPCIIFIDEVDAIGKSRDTQHGNGNDEREQTLNQLLAEMDGFDTSKGLVVLAATNRPEVLDKALLRPGRFDRRIIVDKPDLKGRIDILKVHAKDVLLDESVDLHDIALATSGAVGSDLANIINEAAIMAVKAGRKFVTQEDLFESVEVVIAGKEKKDRILGKEEKKIVAYHEVGHALITAVEKNSEPVQKITIVPRTMGALGYVMQVPEEEKYLMSKAEILTRIRTLFGGRAAEKVIFDSITTGASNDIEKATSLARSMVTQYGMSDKFGLMGLESVESRYLDGSPVRNCGEETSSEIDKEVMKILQQCYDEAEEIIRNNMDALESIGEYLFEKETISGKQFMKLYREVKGIPEPEEEDSKGDKSKKKTSEKKDSKEDKDKEEISEEKKSEDYKEKDSSDKEK